MEDEDTGEIGILMEPVHYITVKESIDAYGYFDEFSASKIAQEIYKGLVGLKKQNLFHGRINGNNIFYDQQQLSVKISDYGIYNVLHRTE